MELNLVAQLGIFKIMGIKPNISELSRTFKKDRKTIRKMYVGKEEKQRKKKPSELDNYKELIAELFTHPGVNVKGAFWYMQNEHKIKTKYDNFKTYVRKNELKSDPKKAIPHPLYETKPGKQIQTDWVEDLRLTTINGEAIDFNLFSATLGYSRFHNFQYSEFKQEADYKRLLLNCYIKIGGTTKEVLTDNMVALVNITNGKRKIHPSVIQFFKDINVKLKLCKVRTPETKGKDEVSNRFVKWLNAYDGKIKDKDHLLQIIDKLNCDINKQVNSRTNLPPVLLFEKEKEHLNPLPSKGIIDSYKDDMQYCKVPSTFVINYKGSKYSVPPNFITKTVGYKEVNGVLYIYHNKQLIAEHPINKKGGINYNENHYKDGLKGKFKDDDCIEEFSKTNLANFKDIGV